jgi:hypothetical protein
MGRVGGGGLAQSQPPDDTTDGICWESRAQAQIGSPFAPDQLPPIEKELDHAA